MACRASHNWLTISAVAILLSCPFPGCQRTDLSGYRPASDHTARPSDGDIIERSEAASREVAPTSERSTKPVELPDDRETDLVDLPPVSALVPINVVDGADLRSLMMATASTPQVGSASGSPIPQNPSEGADATATPEIRKIEVLIKEKSFRTDPKSGALRVSFDDLDLLKVLNMDPVTENAVELMPEWLRGLNGKVIRLRGIMFPTFESEGIERFVLARDSQACCFGPNAKIYHLVEVKMKDGKSTSYIPSNRFFDVIGRFRIELSGQDGQLFGLYFIDDAEVIDR